MLRYICGIILGLVMLTLSACQPQTPLSSSLKWHDGAPLYEVYVRAFSPEGTIAALTARLPELDELGVKNLWLMPIHPIGELGRKGSFGCPYSVRDYFAVNPEYGSADDLKALISAAHGRGMRVMLDLVANHCANDHVEMPNHPDWFLRDSTGAFTREVADWSDVTDWNYDNPAVYDYLDSAMTYWVKNFDIDGYRCDVAGMAPDAFWRQAITRLKALKPDVFLLAEWAAPEMIADGFAAVYDWDLYHRMRDHRDGKITLDSLWDTVERWHATFPDTALSLRFVENHDEPRAAEAFGLPQVKAYAALVFTLPGVPLLYNGQEVGATVRPSLFEREPIDWSVDTTGGMRTLYRRLIAERQASEALRRGEIKRLKVEAPPEVLVFERCWREEVMIVAINFSDKPFAGMAGPDLTLDVTAWGCQLTAR